MIKEKYDPCELEIIRFRTSDVLLTSGESEDDELPFVPNPKP